MAMSFDSFIQTYSGKLIDTDNSYGGQCMDLMHEYNRSVLGLPLVVLAAPTAYQAYLNSSPLFDKIPNTPTGVPQKGDIMFWNTSVGSAGHVAVFIDGNTTSFRSFDQNWPTGSVSHIQSHNYNGVAGWLRYKASPTNPSNGTTNISEENRPMTPGEEKLAYNIVLGRQPEGAPTGRTAFQFIRDAEPELSQQRADARANVATITNLKSQVDSLSARPTKEELQAVVDKLNAAQAQQSQDTLLLDNAGNWLTKLFNRLFKKG